MKHIILTFCLLSLSCGVDNNPEDVADAFCFRYFIELNQRGALEISSGLAASKLEKEIKLLKGDARAFEGGEREFHDAKPFIDYKLIQRTEQAADRVSFIYEITIEPRQGTEKLKREIIISAVWENDRWTVNNYDIEHKFN